MEKTMSDKKNLPSDLTNKLLIENMKLISQDMRLIKQTLLKIMGDVNFCVTQGDVIATILEESQIVGKGEIDSLVEDVLDERDTKVKTIFEDIMEQVEAVKEDDSELAELKRLLKNSHTTGEA
jgi:hypothetical protein